MSIAFQRQRLFCLYCKLFTLSFLQNTGLISTKLCIKHFGGRVSCFVQMKGKVTFKGEIIEEEWKYGGVNKIPTALKLYLSPFDLTKILVLYFRMRQSQILLQRWGMSTCCIIIFMHHRIMRLPFKSVLTVVNP